MIHSGGPFGKGCHEFPDAFLDALGDFYFAFASEQLHRTHFTHVHTNRVSSAVLFCLDSRQRCCGFSSSDFIGGGVAGGDQELFGIGGGFVNADPHVVDHLNDIFYLIWIRNILR